MIDAIEQDAQAAIQEARRSWDFLEGIIAAKRKPIPSREAEARELVTRQTKILAAIEELMKIQTDMRPSFTNLSRDLAALNRQLAACFEEAM